MKQTWNPDRPMILKSFHIGKGAWLAALVFTLLGLYFSASVLTAHPSFHHHSDASSVPDSDARHGKSSHEGSGSDTPASHGHGNCQICHIQSMLANAVPPEAPILSFSIRFRPFPPPPYASFVPQVLIAGVQSRGPPAILPG
jgi:hypothetical protein